MDPVEFYAAAANTIKGMKAVAASRKMAWYVYSPGKTALDALWSVGPGTAAPSKTVEAFAEYALTAKRKIFIGKMPRVTLDGTTHRVFQPKGKAPPAATLYRDATVLGIKGGAATQIPKSARQIFFDPDMLLDVESEDEPVVRAAVVEQNSAVATALEAFARILLMADGFVKQISQISDTHDEADPDEALAQSIYAEMEEIAAKKIPAAGADKIARDRRTELQDLCDALEELVAHARSLADGKPKRLAMRTKARSVPVKVMEAEVRLNAARFEAGMLGIDLSADDGLRVADEELALLINALKTETDAQALKQGLDACDARFKKLDDALFSRSTSVDTLIANAPEVTPTGGGPIRVHELLRRHGWAGLISAYAAQTSILEAAFNFRKVFVDQLLASMRAAHPALIWKSVGSMSLTSDYDITLTIPGDPVGAIGVVQAFNQGVAALFGAQPGTVFDTNLYVRDFSSVNAKGRGSVSGIKDTPVPEKPRALKKMLEAGQDVAALLKQRRFMDQGEFFLLMEQTAARMEASYKKQYGDPVPAPQQQELERLIHATTQQFETADAQFQLNQSRLRKAEGMPKAIQDKVEAFLNPPGLDDQVAQLDEMRAMLQEEMDPVAQKELQAEIDRMFHAIEQIPAHEVAPLRQLLQIARAQLSALEKAGATAAEIKRQRAEILRLEGELANKEADLLREEGGDLALEISNALYLGSMKEAAEIEQRLTIDLKLLERQTLQAKIGAGFPDDKDGSQLAAARLALDLLDTELDTLGVPRTRRPTVDELNAQIDSTKAVLRDKISEGAFFASEAYQTEGAVEHVVQGMQAGGKLDGVSTWQLLESFNENVGDFMKDMKHYETVDDPHIIAKGFYKSSKYIHRILDTIKEIKIKFNVTGILPFEGSILGDAEQAKKRLEDTVLAIRKGAMEFIPADGEILTEADLEKRRDAYVLEQLDSIFQSTSLTHLANTMKRLSSEINAWVRTQEMERVAIADRAEEAAYFRAV